MNKLMVNEIEEINKEELESEGFKVDNLEAVNWVFRKISALKQQADENKKLADAEIERINSWLEKENKYTNNSIEWFEGVLKAYIIDLRRVNPKARVNTPYGKISFRKAHKWNYEDDKVLSWLKENDPLLIKTKEEINKAELKKLYKNGIDTSTGEVIDGITIVEEESISIVTGGNE